MDLRARLAILADAAKYDASCASSGAKRGGNGRGIGDATGSGICHSYTPDGRCVSLLKILLTNHCIYDCKYCVNRITSDVPRARFTVDEVVNLTLEFYRRNYIEGLFLSSGIIQTSDYTMQQLVEVAKSLRTIHHFNGYIHLKATPNASPALLAEAGKFADRLSVNIELPTQADLDQLAPDKRVDKIESTMSELGARISAAKEEQKKSPIAPKFAPAGQSTQMIVGATAASDATILRTSSDLYHRHKLRRVYYSAFSPIPHGDTRLPLQPPPLMREHRLYQADWLMRFYGFGVGEIAPIDAPNLDLRIDPKLAWALRNRQRFPIDLNRAPREMLLRVPGLGVRNVNKIIETRRFHRMAVDELRKLNVSLRKAGPWIIADGANAAARFIDSSRLRALVAPRDEQLELFTAATAARTGEV